MLSHVSVLNNQGKKGKRILCWRRTCTLSKINPIEEINYQAMRSSKSGKNNNKNIHGYYYPIGFFVRCYPLLQLLKWLGWVRINFNWSNGSTNGTRTEYGTREFGIRSWTIITPIDLRNLYFIKFIFSIK